MSTIREARENAGLTQQAMSNLMGIPKRSIEQWEGGQRKPPAYVERLVVQELERMAEEGAK